MKIEKDRMTVCDTNDNLVETEEGITCGCGNPKLKIVFHIDGIDFYGYQYSCICGNSITMECKRSEEDSMYWMD
jgi:hypothetical protein